MNLSLLQNIRLRDFRTPVMWLSAIAVLMVPLAAMAGTKGAGELDVAKLIMGLAGGLAVFLYGMELMGDSLKQVAGARMKKIIGALSSNRFAGVATGATTTAVVQSSSVTTVMVVGFITAGLMTMPQALGVILGANIGTTITGQIIAFKVTKYSMWLIAAGFFTSFIVSKPIIKKWALVVLGLGLVFFGLTMMSGAMKPLRSLAEFRDLMSGGHSLIVAVLIGAAFTALIQSSSATTGIVIVMAADGLIPLETGIALALGANIGTCVTAGLACIGKPREAVRAALAHSVFNIVGVLAITPFIPQFTGLLESMFAGAEVARQIANAHTIFNVANTIIFLPFLGVFAKLLMKIIPPSREETVEIGAKLDPSLATTPSAALEVARAEVVELGATTRKMLELAPLVSLHADANATAQLGTLHSEALARHGAVSKYLTLVTTERMSSADADALLELMTASTRIRSIGNVLRHTLVAEDPTPLKGDAATLVTKYHGFVMEGFDASMKALETGDRESIARALVLEDDLEELDHQARRQKHVDATSEDRTADLVAFDKQLAVIEDLRRVYNHASSIARYMGESQAARLAA